MIADKIDFIVIDDSKLDIFIAESIIKSSDRCNSVTSFINAQDALTYLQEKSIAPTQKVFILVDIYMPIMNGFEFIETLETLLPLEKRKNYSINILSSTINEVDINKAKSYKSLQNIIKKPLVQPTFSKFLLSVSSKQNEPMKA